MQPEFVNRADAAAYIREKWGRPCSSNLLAKLAVRGSGPQFVKIGRFPVYTFPWLDDWVKPQIVGPLQSTSETPGARHLRKARPAKVEPVGAS